MEIDTRRQQALVDAQKSTENQKKAFYDYNELEIERQRKLFEAGVTSRDTLDQAEQSFQKHARRLGVGNCHAQVARGAARLLPRQGAV
jgi:multidrug resistance efflux pump